MMIYSLLKNNSTWKTNIISRPWWLRKFECQCDRLHLFEFGEFFWTTTTTIPAIKYEQLRTPTAAAISTTTDASTKCSTTSKKQQQNLCPNSFWRRKKFQCPPILGYALKLNLFSKFHANNTSRSFVLSCFVEQHVKLFSKKTSLNFGPSQQMLCPIETSLERAI